MLATADLKILSRWCRNRRLNWAPAAADDGAPTICLMPIGRHAPWQDLLLVAQDGGYRLRDAPGSILATASDLPALLDAVDAGIGLPEPAYRSTRSSASAGWPRLRNSVESAIT